MRTRLSFLAICSLLLGLLSTSTPANSLTANLEILAVTHSKPGEVELTFVSRIASKSITSYQITAKPKSALGLTFSKTYTKKVSGYITQKISPLTPGVDYIFILTATTNKKKVITAAPFTHLVSSNVPSTPLITKVEATDADEAVVFFTAPKDDGGSPVYYYTLTSNPAAVVITYLGQGSGSITIGGLTKATTYTFTLTAHNINGSSKAAISPAPITTLAEKIVRVSPTSSSSNAPTLAAPAFTLSSSSQSVLVNNAITTVTNTSTGGEIASYAISPAAPSGLSFSTTTGQLSGTPTSTQSATNYTITATNAAGSATATFTLTVTVGTPAFSLSSASETRVATTAITGYTITSTGAPITSYSLVGSLPTGLSFSTSDGRITGTPTETRTATTYTVIGASASGETATATYRLRVTGDIGDTGPGNGIIYYYRAAGFSCGPTMAATCKYLEVAPNTWWGGASDTQTVVHLPRKDGIATPGMDSTTAIASALVIGEIGSGYKNTNALSSRPDLTLNNATLVRAYRGGSQSDWYIPSAAELNLMCQWARGVTQNVSATCTGGSLRSDFSSSSYYYSSSQSFLVTAPTTDGGLRFVPYVLSFDTGSFPRDQWANTFNFLRPIRAF